jgi:hypothetical protein
MSQPLFSPFKFAKSQSPSKLKILEEVTRAQYGKTAVNVHGEYAAAKRIQGVDKLPGLYIICACVESIGPCCTNCTGPEIVFKIGLSTDLATRLDHYHTSYPKGFTIMHLYVLKQLDGSYFPQDAYLRTLLEEGERLLLNAFEADPSFSRIRWIRPGRSEWFSTFHKEALKPVLDAVFGVRGAFRPILLKNGRGGIFVDQRVAPEGRPSFGYLTRYGEEERQKCAFTVAEARRASAASMGFLNLVKEEKAGMREKKRRLGFD